MNKLWNWLKNTIEVRPVTFVIVGGIFSYVTAFGSLAAMSFIFGQSAWLIGAFVLPLIIVAFHWFVARYERKSWIAQVLAITPAIFLVFLIMLTSLLLRID